MGRELVARDAPANESFHVQILWNLQADPRPIAQRIRCAGTVGSGTSTQTFLLFLAVVPHQRWDLCCFGYSVSVFQRVGVPYELHASASIWLAVCVSEHPVASTYWRAHLRKRW